MMKARMNIDFEKGAVHLDVAEVSPSAMESMEDLFNHILDFVNQYGCEVDKYFEERRANSPEGLERYARILKARSHLELAMRALEGSED